MSYNQLLERLRDRRDVAHQESLRIAAIATKHERKLSANEQTKFDEAMAEVDELDLRIASIEDADERAKELEHMFTKPGANEPAERTQRHPLAFTAAALDSAQDALDLRESGRFPADLEERAALATTTFGAPRAWGSNVLDGPRLLHVVAGVPTQPTDAVLAQVPNLTLPTAQGSVGENVSLAEYAASTAGSVSLARFGRWTDLSAESNIGTDVGSLTAMHRIGVAKDLDKVLIDATETAAGAAVAFTADVPAAIRKAMAQVIDNTAAADAEQLVILTHPDNAALLQDVTPIGGQTMAESFQRFSGAIVYASSAVNTGFMTVANLRAGSRYFEARTLRTEVDTNIKTDTITLATSVIGGYGIGLTGGFAVMVDVVTP